MNFYAVINEDRCSVAVNRSERMRWVQAFTPLASDKNDERIYEEWGMCSGHT